MTPEEYREMEVYIQRHRINKTPFDILAAGNTSGTDKGRVSARMVELSEAGVTWW